MAGAVVHLELLLSPSVVPSRVSRKTVASRTCNRLTFALMEPLTALLRLVTERTAQRFASQPLLYVDEVPQV